jgi:tetratricopeptide (TPR) repeat protein
MILKQQGRYIEAEARYEAAVMAAHRAGDQETETILLQHQAGLARELNQVDRAIGLYKRTLKLFQEMNNQTGIMQICSALGVVEQESGRLAEARTWHEHSREIAQRLGHTSGLGMAAQNIGIVCRLEGEAASQRGDPKGAINRFREALRSFEVANRIDREQGNQPFQAQSHNQLGQVHLLLGELAEAERHAQQARRIREGLGLKEVHTTYDILARIARARGDAAQAAEWERKRDAVLEELERRAQGPGGGGLPPQFLQAVQQLAIACAQAGFGQAQPQELDPGAESALAQIEKLPAPLPDLAAFLRRLAARELPPVPSTLPPELQQSLKQLLEAIKEAGPRN